MDLQGPGTIDIVNSIIYGNWQHQFITFQNNVQPATVNFSHSLIEGGTNPSIVHVAGGTYGVDINWGDGIIDSPPMFLGEVENGYDSSDKLYYQPSVFSPTIDAGTPDTTGLNLPPHDLLYNKRIWDGLGDGEAIVDIGAFEYNAPEYIVSVDDHVMELPPSLMLMNNPNPFNPETTIVFTLDRAGEIKLEIYNIRGQRIDTLLQEYRQAGEHSVGWNGTDDRGKPVSSGVYFYRITAGENREQRKMLLLK